MMTIEIVETFAYKVTEQRHYRKTHKKKVIYTGLTGENRGNFTYKSEIYYEFIGSGYLAHEILIMPSDT